MNFKSKQIIDYEQVIAGALLKFKSIDAIDFSLLIEDFQEKTNIDVTGLWYNLNNIGKYIKEEKNIITLKEGISLDYFIEEENCTLREKLLMVAGNIVNNYFKDVNVESYQQKKEEKLKENKDRILKSANILLISEIEENYDELVKYGFQKVDYFKSLIRADKYFAKYPERLNKYHIILQGHSNIHTNGFDVKFELENKIITLKNTKHILETPLYKYNYSDHTEFVAYLRDDKNWKNWNIEESSYTAIFDRIIENTLINHTLDKAQILEKLPEYSDYINPNRLPLPTTKSKLKILFLDEINLYDRNIKDLGLDVALGLDVTFNEDFNHSLKYVISHLGDYDIIIASSWHSFNLVSVDIESTEQCKDTGRDLTLLVSYKDSSICQYGEDDEVDYAGIGSKINLDYKFAGNFAPDIKCHKKEFRVLRKSLEFLHEHKESNKYYDNKIAVITGILGASVNIYNDALLQNNKPPIKDLDIKTAEEFDADYEIVDKQEEERKNSILAPIRTFDSIRYAVSSYLNYRRKGIITQTPEGLKITQGKNKIKVENIYQGKTLCTITFSKNYKQENFKIFEIQTVSKKGTLSSPQIIGLYTKKYEKLENVPSRPNERQLNALSSIAKKINVSLLPLTNKAWEKNLELEKKKLLILERKPKKYKK